MAAEDSRKFQRLREHLYPLTDISTTQTQVTAIPERLKRSDTETDSEGYYGTPIHTKRHDGITVTKTWNLQS